MLSALGKRFSSETLKHTPLFNIHKEMGGEMVPFAGFAMPVKYDGVGIIESHLHCRTNASVFDVSHMGQVFVLPSVSNAASSMARIARPSSRRSPCATCPT